MNTVFSSAHSVSLAFRMEVKTLLDNRRFAEITGKDNLTVFSYSGRVKSPEWRRQLRRADLRQFQIFRHGPIIIYTRLPTGGTYYPICMFPTNSLFTGIRHFPHALTVPPTKACLLCATLFLAFMLLYVHGGEMAC